MKKIIVSAMLSLASLSAHAGFIEDLHAKFPQTADAKIEKSFGNFYSIVRADEVLYVNEDISILIKGDVIDLKQNKSLTTELVDANRPKVDLSLLDTKDAFKIGKGPDKIYVFSDPNCPYCRKLEREFESLPGVTIYLFPFPVLGPESAAIAQSVWCNKEKAKTWHHYLTENIKPTPATCANPIERNIAVAEKMKIRGTPAIIFSDGTLIPGAVPASKIQAAIAKAKQK